MKIEMKTPRPADRDSAERLERIRAAARFVAMGKTVPEAAASVGMTFSRLINDRGAYPHVWAQELDKARPKPAPVPRPPRQLVRTADPTQAAILRRAAEIVARGETLARAAKSMGINLGSLKNLIARFRPLWDTETTSATIAIQAAAAKMVASGKALSEAACQLGLEPRALARQRQQHPEIWAQNGCDVTQVNDLSDDERDTIEKAAVWIASGATISAAAVKMHVSRGRLDWLKQKYPEEWGAVIAATRKTRGLNADRRERPETRAKIRKAAGLQAAGLSHSEIADKMGVPVSSVRAWRDDYAAFWAECYDGAMATVVEIVRAEAGTDAVLRDPADYIRRARAADRWATKHGEPLFTPSTAPTVSSFYRDYYVPVRLSGAARKTVESYEHIVRSWVLFTADPPLSEITPLTLAKFKTCTERTRGLDRVSRVSVNTVRTVLRHLQAIVDLAGPPYPRHRDGAGIIKALPPWIRPPKPEDRLPRFVPLELMSQVYTAAICMEVPRIAGIKPPAFWRALLAVAFETQLRRRSLFELRWQDVEWEARRLNLPPCRLKSGRRQIFPLNDVALKHLKTMRKASDDLVFPWPSGSGCFHKHFHKLQTQAGIAKKDHFGLHDLRKTAASLLWEGSPQAAQYALGHAHMNTTAKHYVFGTPIVARALEALPQPAAFTQ